jgi:[ribosomal protein S18]-alanine N-acetyltransferase
MQYRTATSNDRENMARLHSETFLQEPWSKDFISKLLNRQGALALLAKTNPPHSSLAGFILLQCAADEAEILTIAVAQDQQRQGIGTKLLERAIKHLTAQNITNLFLDVSCNNQPAIALYDHLGFIQCGNRPNYYKDGSDGVLMAKTLYSGS